MNKFLRAGGIVALTIILPLATSSGVLASVAPTTGDLPSLGEAESNEAVTTGLTAEAHVVQNNESGNLTSLTWSLENTSDNNATISWATGTSYMYESKFFSGVTLVSDDDGRRFHPVMYGDGGCLCSGTVSADFKNHLKPGEKIAYWSMFSVPEDIDSVTVEIRGFEPIEDIPIS